MPSKIYIIDGYRSYLGTRERKKMVVESGKYGMSFYKTAENIEQEDFTQFYSSDCLILSSLYYSFRLDPETRCARPTPEELKAFVLNGACAAQDELEVRLRKEIEYDKKELLIPARAHIRSLFEYFELPYEKEYRLGKKILYILNNLEK